MSKFLFYLLKKINHTLFQELQLCVDVVLSVSDEHAVTLVIEYLLSKASKPDVSGESFYPFRLSE